MDARKQGQRTSRVAVPASSGVAWYIWSSRVLPVTFSSCCTAKRKACQPPSVCCLPGHPRAGASPPHNQPLRRSGKAESVASWQAQQQQAVLHACVSGTCWASLMIWLTDLRLGELAPSAPNREQMAQANRVVTTQPVKI